MRNKFVILAFLFSVHHFTHAAIRVPFKFKGGLIVAEFNLNGKVKAPFVFDTGASTTVIDSMAAAALQMKAEGRQTNTGAGGSASFPVVYNQQIELAKDEIVNLTQCVIVNLQNLRERNGEDFIGIIGYDLLKNYITYIDFDKKELIFDTQNPETLKGYSKLSFSFGNNIPIPQLNAGITLQNGKNWKARCFLTAELRSPSW